MSASSLNVVILGAASGIAEATARLYAHEGAKLLLAGRKGGRLDEIAADLRVRGARSVDTVVVDFVEAEARTNLAKMTAILGGVDHILIAWGILGEQQRAEHDEALAASIIDVNLLAPARWVLAAADQLEAAGHGSLVVLGSVAGDRGRRTNYIYGAAKAGLATLVVGIAHRFAGKGPRVVVVKPGPTDTAMTAGMTKRGPLWASPEQVALLVRRAADKGGPVQYAPRRWGLIMLIIRLLPTAIFNRLNF